MKKRRIAIVAFLLVACMVIGFGFAASTQNLFFISEIKVGNSELDITYTDADPFAGTYNGVTYTEENNFCATNGATLVDTHKAKMVTKVMNEIGQTAIAVFQITNNMDMTTVSITHNEADHSLTGGLSLDYFNISHEFRTDLDAAGTENVASLAPGASVYLVISISVAKEITGDIGNGATLEFTAAYQAQPVA